MSANREANKEIELIPSRTLCGLPKERRTEMQQRSTFSDRSSFSNTVSFAFFNVLNHFSHLRSLYVKNKWYINHM